MGGDIQRILWELPLSIGLQLRHAILQMDGASTVQSEEDEAAQFDAIARTVDDG